ncbi:MAG TPA: O-methyltransferase [Actinomycetota bacterium]|nr:O-methyltransferase [Actinomycetota bacterium]
MDFPGEQVFKYMRSLHDKLDEPVLVEMEAVAAEAGFPIVGRVVGAALETLARTIGAARVFEMGSGFGYSGYWFARAVGESGEVTLTDGDPENALKAKDYLTRAGLWDRCRFEVGDAIEALGRADGEFDVIYCDIDKGDYPAAFKVARERVRVGGLYICDNVLWSGRVAADDADAWTVAIRQHNLDIYGDESFLPVILPIRDGVIMALRTK